MGTHESQKHPSESINEGTDFMVMIREVVSQPNRSQHFIINMDQTPVYFTMHPKKTIEKKGKRIVNLRKSTGDTKRATFAMCVTASGRKLKPLLVFKGKPNGRIAKTEFPTFSNEIEYACQDSAWMDEGVMLQWAQKCLKPYVDTAPEGVIPVLLLDSYRCHMMESVVSVIQEMGVEVHHIPGGCTGLCQPVDVGINRPFKSRIRQMWTNWMIDEGLELGSHPTRGQVVEWSLNAFKELTEPLVRNSWRHDAFTYFPLTVPTLAEYQMQQTLIGVPI